MVPWDLAESGPPSGQRQAGGVKRPATHPAPCRSLMRRGDAAQQHGSYSSMPALTIADPAKNIVAIRVQLVKYILNLLNCTVWPAPLLGHSMSGSVMHVGSHGGPRAAINSPPRHRRGVGARHPPRPRAPRPPPGRDPPPPPHKEQRQPPGYVAM